jgi:hypothetical protein
MTYLTGRVCTFNGERWGQEAGYFKVSQAFSGPPSL